MMPGLSITAPGALAKLRDTAVTEGDGTVNAAQLTYDADAGVWVPRLRTPFDAQLEAGPTDQWRYDDLAAHNPPDAIGDVRGITRIGSKLWHVGGSKSGGGAYSTFGYWEMAEGGVYYGSTGLVTGGETIKAARCAVLDDRLYAYTDAQQFDGRGMWRIEDLASDGTQLADAPENAGHHSLTACGSFLYGMRNQFHRYDPWTDAWEGLPLPADGSTLAGAVGVYAGQLYRFATDRVHRYDPPSETWERLGDPPSDRPALGTPVMLSGLMWFLGGAGPTYVYSPSMDTWDQLDAQPPVLGSHSGDDYYLGRTGVAGVFGSRIVCHCGSRQKASGSTFDNNMPGLHIYG